MRITIARLRLWIIILAALLIAALIGSYVYRRYQIYRQVADLPGKLAKEIARSSSEFTYSKSVKGHTAFTIHASSAVQFKGGTSATLHNVTITMYGAQGDRSDRISGSEFNYDQKAGIVSAKGEVLIDLQGADLAGSPVAPQNKAAASALASAPAPAGHPRQDQRPRLQPAAAGRHHHPARRVHYPPRSWPVHGRDLRRAKRPAHPPIGR